jgi:dehydrogenase/reductase SDR family protein 7B
MNLKSLRGKTVWITGASAGIGLELAVLAAGAGARLHLFSSRKDSLAEAARLCTARGAMSVDYKAVDLSDTAVASAASQKVISEGAVPDFLILNAGISQRSLAAETDLSVSKKIMDLNFFGSVAVARTVLPAMIEKGGGGIAVTSSLTGIFGFPLRSSYAASKHALHGYFESLSLEYASAGIRVTMAVPGRIRTNIALSSLRGDGTPHGSQDPGLEKGMDVVLCAQKYWRAVLQGKREKVIGGSETLMVKFYRYLPAIFRIIARKTSPL